MHGEAYSPNWLAAMPRLLIGLPPFGVRWRLPQLSAAAGLTLVRDVVLVWERMIFSS
jgi:hypothetical protein